MGMNELIDPFDFMDNGGGGSTDRDEVFVREYLRTGRADLACVRAGITDPEYNIRVVADRQMARPEIKDLIRELKALGVGGERVEYTRDLFLDELQAIHERARDSGNFAPAITAIKTQAQLLGMMDQTVNVNHTVTAKDLSLDELRAMVSERARPVRVIDGN